MKLKSKFLVLLLAVVFAFTMFAMAACGDDESEEVSISLSQTSLTLVEGGQNATINATVKGTSEAVKWTVDSSTVVQIQYEGKTCVVKPLAEGTAKVSAKVGDKTATCNVTVTPAPKPAVTITLSQSTLNLTKGDNATEVTATLTNAEDGDTVQWSLANGGDAVVTITANGNKVSVLPIGVGTTTLTAKIGDVTKTVTITVAKAPVSLTLDKEKVELNLGNGQQPEEPEEGEVAEQAEEGEEGNGGEEDAEVKLTETVTATATNNEEKVAWKIGSTKVATIEVSEDGNVCTVTAVNVGTTTLTASVEGVSKTIGVVVDGEGGAIEIELSEAEDLELNVGAQKEISATVAGTLNAPVWSVDDEEVVEIVGEGNVITVKALKEGETTLSVTVGEETKTLKITVVDPVTLSLDKEELNLKVGAGNGEINVTAEGAEGEYTYEVEGDDYITVEKNGDVLTVTPVETGTATITVSYGGKTATVAVTVTGMPKITDWAVVDNAIYGETVDGVRGDIIWHHLFLNDIDAKQYDFDSYTATVTVDGKEGVIFESQQMTAGDISAHAYHLHLHIEGNKYQTTVFTINFKKDGEVVAIGTYTRKGDKEVKIDRDEISIKKDEKGTISVTEINGSTNLSGKAIAWTIDKPSIATIPESSNGTSVEITGVAEGTATLTCTVGEGEDAITKTCTITVYLDEKPPVEATTITNINDNNHVYETAGGIVIHFHFYIPTELEGKYKKTNIEVQVKKNGVVDETASVFDVETPNNPIHLHVKVSGALADVDTTKYEITFNWKNDDGDIVMTGVFTKAPPKTLIINDTLNLTLKEGETVTGTVEATVSSTVEGDIAWTISDPEVATIEVSEDGMSVTVTALKKGTATLTATVDGVAPQTCTVNVLEEGETPTITVVELTNVIDANDVYPDGADKFAIHFYIQLGEMDGKVSIASDRLEITVTKDGEAVSGITLSPNSEIAGGANCHLRVQIPGSKDDASGSTFVITFKFKNTSGDVIAQGSFTKTL